ncbi:hypothetical protein TGAMA5MH_05584 [Trichoderma gamsii]|uniref:Uncharacterized protein n=1 Tax=Trichoderma gamsii TaxID=398673 RepID=A0A2K0TBD4_9HYPO|nr:hypothetical protein TGAMA5MH_05584 [Trichoderma gamsii]
MMLTIKQQSTTYGYKSVHDLPTPPSTSRPSPPLNHQDPSFKPYLVSQNSPVQPMSTSHRGLPPPAAMTLPPQQPSSVGPPPPPPHHSQPPPPPPLAPSSHQAQQPWPSPSAGLPPPPQQWQGAEESMKTWLQAKTEEEKTRQEEEKTRQETLRLEQRRIEMDILRASLNGGIPPPIVPLVFAGMGSGGTLPQAALEWAQQFMAPAQSHHPQLLPPQRPHSPDHPREPMVPGHGVVYATSPAQVTPVQGTVGYAQYPGSPTRPRGQTVSGVIGRPMGVVSNTAGMGNPPQPPGQGPPPVMPPYQAHQGHSHTPSQSSQHDTSPSIYFHHWQPPATQSGSSSNRPGSPSGEAQKKRKTTGGMSQQVPRAPSEDRFRSPPPFAQASSSNPASPSRRSHKRQRSDVSWYRPSNQMYSEDPDRPRARTPTQAPSWGPTPREREESRSAKQSVSSLLSREPDDSGGLPRQGPQPPRLEPPAPMPRARGPGDQRPGERGGELPLPQGEADPRSRP